MVADEGKNEDATFVSSLWMYIRQRTSLKRVHVPQ